MLLSPIVLNCKIIKYNIRGERGERRKKILEIHRGSNDDITGTVGKISTR